MRALLWLATGEVIDAQGAVRDPQKLACVDRRGAAHDGKSVQWLRSRASAEAFRGIAADAAADGLIGVLAGRHFIAGTTWSGARDSVDRRHRGRHRES